MDFKDAIQRLSEKISKQKDTITTEEGTKNAFIMPLISILGYDVFDPFEVVPELDCDLIKKKGEKIDYAIMMDDSPVILIECKHCSKNLDLHNCQLQKYFVASKARFGVLTNGVEYRFYTDLDKANIMDEKPFLIVNLLDLSDSDIEQLKKFHKSYYCESDILSTANELKYTTEIKEILVKEFASPSIDFVKFFARQTYTTGQVTQRVVDQFTPIVKRSINGVINDIISDRLNSAIKNEQNAPASVGEKVVEIKQHINGVITTDEELDGYNIVKSILRKDIDVSRISFKDYKTYFVVYVDASHKWVCRLYFNWKKYIAFPAPADGVRNEEKIEIQCLDDIFNYSDKLIESLNKIVK